MGFTGRQPEWIGTRRSIRRDESLLPHPAQPDAAELHAEDFFRKHAEL
jgi:hypothetical protein